ncbi:MAG: Radical domain protein [Anaerospora sp.]|jgi:radical SAM protein with 4Fe4S-binding SPASM domain|nr:Radical domain protein [Anaerospora sp.]
MKKYKKVYIEITNACNLRCDFCPETKRTAQFMSEDDFQNIASQVKPFADYIYLHVKGEPLLHPKLGRLLDISFDNGLKVNITTNGTLIDKAADVLLAKPAVRQINFSLHSFDGNENNLSKDTYIDRILCFANRAIAKSGIIISLRLWNLEEALLTEDQRKRNADILHRIEDNFKLSYQIRGNLSQDKALKISDRVYLNQDYEFKWPDLQQAEDTAPGTCYGLRQQIAILVDGTVIPCCLDGEGVINLGSIHQESLAKILQGARAERIRQGFSRQYVVEELCRKCGFRKRFAK